jgi:hypothetical protein
MSPLIRYFSTLLITALITAIVLSHSAVSLGQDSGVNLALHANSHANAADIGLPAYPGATLYKDANNSPANLGLTAGDFHLTVLAVSYVTNDSASQVLAFYRKPLSRYGEVLECDQGKPIGGLAVTRSGLSCGDDGGKTNSSSGHELRAGSPHRYRIVAIDDNHPKDSTRFGLVYLDLPKDSGGKTN